MIRPRLLLIPVLALFAVGTLSLLIEGDLVEPPATEASGAARVSPPVLPATELDEPDGSPAPAAKPEPAPQVEAPRPHDQPPAPTRSAPRGARLVATAEAPAKSSVGHEIRLVVRLENRGDEPAELPAFREGSDSVSLELQVAGKRFTPERVHPEAKTEEPPQLLYPGQVWELFLDLPAVVAGPWEIRPRFATAYGVQPERVTVQVDPVNGATEASVLLHTNHGPIELQLYARDVPATAFHIARLVHEGFYDGLGFHRIVPGFVIQGGDPKGDGAGGTPYKLPFEAPPAELPKHLLHAPGRVGLARGQQKDEGGSQFYICLADAPHLDGEWVVFGQVEHGMDVVERIAAVDHDSNQRPLEPVTILWARLRLRL